MAAAERSHAGCLRLLLSDKDVDMARKTFTGKTALAVRALIGCLEV